MFINEILETSSSDDEEENLVLKYVKEEKPKIETYIDIINKYSNEEVNLYIKNIYRILFYISIIVINNISSRETFVENVIHT